MAGSISFEELLAANEEEALHWRAWFEKQSADVLEIPTGIARAENVRGLLLHIFAVELRYAERLHDLAPSAYEQLPTESVAALFGVGERARILFRRSLADLSDNDLATVSEFPTRTAGTLRASKRKMFLQAMFHSMRHWAQMATMLREHGHETDWRRDFLLSKVME